MLRLPPPDKIHILKGDEDSSQRVTLPPALVNSYPDYYEVELIELPDNILTVKFVDPKTPCRYKRYKLQRHKGSTSLTVPRHWFRDRMAQKGDLITVHSNLGQGYIQLRKDLRDLRDIYMSAPADTRGEVTALALIKHFNAKNIALPQTDPLYAGVD